MVKSVRVRGQERNFSMASGVSLQYFNVRDVKDAVRDT